MKPKVGFKGTQKHIMKHKNQCEAEDKSDKNEQKSKKKLIR